MNVCEPLPNRPQISKPVTLLHGLVLILLGSLVAGCGSPEEGSLEPTEEDEVTKPLTYIAGAAANPEEFKKWFVDGAAPPEAEQKEYTPFLYAPNKVRVSGDTATVNLSVIDSHTSKSQGDVDWTLQRVGSEWKLTAAPLP